MTATALPRQTFVDDIRQGFVYERVQHITLKSIANNPDIKEGMSRASRSTPRSSATRTSSCSTTSRTKTPEKVRVTGPFTVESLSPHRSLSFAATAPESLSETEAAKDADAPNFEQSILDNLAKAGIQNGRRQERITFESFETYAGEYIQAIGSACERSGRSRT